VVALLLGAAGASGAFAGFATGVAWAIGDVPALGPMPVAAIVALVAVADVGYWSTGSPAPVSVRRQVPRVWTTLFGPEVVAVLYGARLGVGPLTILPTWSWWGATILAASTGPIGGAAIGGLFGVVRVVLMVTTAEWARRGMAARMGTVRRLEVAVSVLIVDTYLVAVPISLAIV
jgi:hypothetical protein